MVRLGLGRQQKHVTDLANQKQTRLWGGEGGCVGGRETGGSRGVASSHFFPTWSPDFGKGG